MNIIQLIQRHQLSTFFVMAFTYSWIWWTGLFIIAPGGLGGGLSAFSVPLLLYGLLGAQGSGVSGIILTTAIEGRKGLHDLFTRIRLWRAGMLWYGVVILTAPLLLLSTLLAMGITVSPKFLPIIPTGQNGMALIATGAVVGIVAGVIEELGWTGFALPRLLARHGAFAATLALGILWSTWHILPSIWGMIPTINALSLLGLVFGLTGFAVIPAYRILMSWVYVNSKGSLLLAIIMHAFYDASIAVFFPSLTTAETLEFYAAFAVALWIVVGVVVIRFGAATLKRPMIKSGSSPATR